jgi:hypothetical protein
VNWVVSQRNSDCRNRYVCHQRFPCPDQEAITEWEVFAIKDGDQSGYQRAAEEAADLDRLLLGEDPKTKQLDDAQHWRRVYQELLDFKLDLLKSTYQRLADMALDDARTEVRHTDQLVLEAESKRFERRLSFWKKRCQDLSPK